MDMNNLIVQFIIEEKKLKKEKRHIKGLYALCPFRGLHTTRTFDEISVNEDFSVTTADSKTTVLDITTAMDCKKDTLIAEVSYGIR
jgi:hypothetical protein